MNDYRILEAIGEGSFGRVFRGQCRRSGNIVALKFIPKRNKVDRELRSLRRECEIQKELFHPNIVRMIDAFETDGEVVAVSEYVPIQLQSLLEKHGNLPEKRVRHIACNLISAIYYLHSLRILHRDIKPQNILLTIEGEAKLCDFGFSRKMGINTYVLTSVKGTPLYMAPELIDESPYDHTADLWSLGCILFELLTGKPPFCTTSIVQLIKMIHLEPIKWPPCFTTDCRNFLEGLLQKEPSQRLTWPHLLDHVWIKDGVIVIKSQVDNSPLTCPLSSSQQEIKELQKQQLIKQGLSQPKLLRNFSEPEFYTCSEQMMREAGNKLPEVKVNVHEDFKINCGVGKFLNNSDLNNEEDSQMLEMKTFIQGLEINKAHKDEHLSFDVRKAVGSSVRKLSTISHESGFKNDDVADINDHDSVPSVHRKDSMVNYYSNSADSSRRGSRPSFPTTENCISSQLSNINEESIGHFSSACGGRVLPSPETLNKPIEKDEWMIFLDKTISEVINEFNFEIFYEQSEINMFISPLQNSTCPLAIIDKIVVMFMLPFVMEPEKPDKKKVLTVYSECKVVPNLVYAIKFIANAKTNLNKQHEYSKSEVNILRSLISLICFLIHIDDTFIVQFCDSVCIFSSYNCFWNIFHLDIHIEITEKILSILNFILNHSPENRFIAEQILAPADDLGNILENLINHKSPNICKATCYFIGHSAKASASYISSLKEEHNMLSDLINLETSLNAEIKKSASFAVSLLLQFFKDFEE